MWFFIVSLLKVFAPSFRPRSPFSRTKIPPTREETASDPRSGPSPNVAGRCHGCPWRRSKKIFPSNLSKQLHTTTETEPGFKKCLVKKKHMFFSVVKILQNHKSGSSTAPNHFSYQLLVVARWSKKLLETNNISKMSRWHSLAKKWWILQTLVAPSIQSTEHCWFKMGWLKPKRLAWICMIKLSKP